MSWVSVAFILLKFALGIVTWARERELISEGHDQAIFEVARSILAKTTAGKKILARVNAMSEAEVDAGLHDLEPK